MTVEGKLSGLRESDILSLQKKFGKNIFRQEKPRTLLNILWDIVKEPMFLLLAFACSLYFILGEVDEGLMMITAMIFVSAISIYQEVKSSKALEALKEFTEPSVTVIRDSVYKLVNGEELVPGDIVELEEGQKIPADAIVIQSNDLTINESILTGESFAVDKSDAEGNNQLFQGTLINTGKCYCRITATGNYTVLGKLGKSISTSSPEPTALQMQINSFVKKLALFGVAGFALVWSVNYLNSGNIIQSLLLGLTLAMSALPEEIPVAFSSFMALGAYYMARHGMITRRPATIENLGAVTVICFDKTGTLTKNKMEVKSVYDFPADKLMNYGSDAPSSLQNPLLYGLLASETKPFDAMEKAIHEACARHADALLPIRNLSLVYEYPLEGKPPMMTHVYEEGHTRTAAAKGAVERILSACRLDEVSQKKIVAHVSDLGSQGLRVLGVASAELPSGFLLPKSQDDLPWKLEGLVALYDPPKENVSQVLRDFYKAGIDIKMVTGDYPETAASIARQIGLQNHHPSLSGQKVMDLSFAELQEQVKDTHLFARMFPEAKLKVIEALKANGEITAMTGDGVNDGPALASAHIGIAMGKKGTEIARQAASLVLTDDNLEKITEAIYQGRKIYNNLRKATRYIVSIHIPIILTASFPLLLGWKFSNLFTPIHVIFLELIMGPTCSIFFEREPVEKNLMSQSPRKNTSNLFSRREMTISIIQGLIISAGLMALNYYFMTEGYDLAYSRTVIFTTLIISNIFLTLAYRSFTDTILKTSRYKNDLAYLVVIISFVFIFIIHGIPAARDLFRLVPIQVDHILLSLAVGFGNVMWFEVYKGLFRQKASF